MKNLIILLIFFCSCGQLQKVTESDGVNIIGEDFSETDHLISWYLADRMRMHLETTKVEEMKIVKTYGSRAYGNYEIPKIEFIYFLENQTIKSVRIKGEERIVLNFFFGFWNTVLSQNSKGDNVDYAYNREMEEFELYIN